MAVREMEAADLFECLDDSTLLCILSKVEDVKALSRCCVLSRRFLELAHSVPTATLAVDRVLPYELSDRYFDDGPGDGDFNDQLGGLNIPSLVRKVSRGIWGYFFSVFMDVLQKPAESLQQLVWAATGAPAKSRTNRECSPAEVLRGFVSIRDLKIELPSGELGGACGGGGQGRGILQWEAEYSATLESCFIFAATSSSLAPPQLGVDGIRNLTGDGTSSSLDGISNSIDGIANPDQPEIASPEPDFCSSSGGLKARILWTVSCLMAASSRHHLLGQIIPNHPSLTALTLTDKDRQGTLCMHADQLNRFKSTLTATTTTSDASNVSSKRTPLPALSMRLWYAPSLALPNGTVLEGATLVAVQPLDRPWPKETVTNMIHAHTLSAFDEPHKTAAGLLAAKTEPYHLQINSF